MERENLKLEILKLVNRHDQKAEDLIVRAKVLEEYVFEDSQVAPQAGKSSEKNSIKPTKK